MLTRPTLALAALAVASLRAAGQLEGFVAPDIPPLDQGSLAERIAFESPLPGAAVSLAIGLAAGFILGKGGKVKPAAAAAAAGVLIAAGLFVTAAVVTTEREVLRQRADRLIDATVQADLPSLRRLLHPGARVLLPPPVEGSEPMPGRESLLAAVDTRLGGQFPIERHAVRELQAQIDGPQAARTQTAVTAEVTGVGTVGSWWVISWQRGTPESEWLATQFELLHLPLAGVRFGG